MVDGVHGHLDHVVRHVVEEHRNILECAMILNLLVEGKNVKVLAAIPKAVMAFVVLVRYVIIIIK